MGEWKETVSDKFGFLGQHVAQNQLQRLESCKQGNCPLFISTVLMETELCLYSVSKIALKNIINSLTSISPPN